MKLYVVLEHYLSSDEVWCWDKNLIGIFDSEELAEECRLAKEKLWESECRKNVENENYLEDVLDEKFYTITVYILNKENDES